MKCRVGLSSTAAIYAFKLNILLIMAAPYSLIDIIKSFVDINQWKIFAEDEHSVALLFGQEADEPLDNHFLILHGDDQKHLLIVRIMDLSGIDPSKLIKITEFIARANNRINQYVKLCIIN